MNDTERRDRLHQERPSDAYVTPMPGVSKPREVPHVGRGNHDPAIRPGDRVCLGRKDDIDVKLLLVACEAALPPSLRPQDRGATQNVVINRYPSESGHCLIEAPQCPRTAEVKQFATEFILANRGDVNLSACSDQRSHPSECCHSFIVSLGVSNQAERTRVQRDGQDHEKRVRPPARPSSMALAMASNSSAWPAPSSRSQESKSARAAAGSNSRTGDRFVCAGQSAPERASSRCRSNATVRSSAAMRRSCAASRAWTRRL